MDNKLMNKVQPNLIDVQQIFSNLFYIFYLYFIAFFIYIFFIFCFFSLYMRHMLYCLQNIHFEYIVTILYMFRSSNGKCMFLYNKCLWPFLCQFDFFFVVENLFTCNNCMKQMKYFFLQSIHVSNKIHIEMFKEVRQTS